MPITIFKNFGGKKLNKVNILSLEKSNGIWNCIKSSDFVKDGDLDFIVGNFGLNSRYRFSDKEPLSVYANDFDGNGRWDAIPSYFLKSVEYPIPSRDELIRQIPILRAKFKNYSDYANATFQDVLTKKQQENSYKGCAFLPESIFLENLGKNDFVFRVC